MLRYKPTFGSSLFKFGKGFLDARCFHLTRIVLLRKAGAAKRTLPQFESFTNNVAGEFHVQTNTNVNENFYGIESDVGVINIEQCSRNVKLDQEAFITRFNEKLNKERIKKASFGSIRLDRDNKPKSHGQFERTTNQAVKMDVSTQNLKTHDLLHSPNTSENLINSRPSPMTDSDEANNRTQIHTEVRASQIEKNGDLKKEDSFIDDLYFTNEVLDNKPDEKPTSKYSPKISDCPDSQNIKSFKTEGVSFLDELYVSNEISEIEKNCNSVEDLSESAMSQQEIKKDFNLKGNSGFIDELYFENKIQSSNVDYANLNRLTARPAEKGFSFIDESYFDNDLVHKKDMDSKQDIKERVDFNSSSIQNSPIAPKPGENFDYYDVKENNKKYEQRGIEYSSKDQLGLFKFENINNFNSKLSHGSLKSDSYTSVNNSNINKPLNSSEKIISHLSNADYQSENPSTHKHKNLKDGINSLANTSMHENIIQKDQESEKKQEYSDKTLKDKKKGEVNSSDNVETAQDFVRKLRTERKQFRPLIKGGKILPSEEKKDSKGYRILSNQVPNLSHFTREEIMTVLKNNILYSDDDIVVLNKPYNLIIHESKTAKDPCLSQYLDELAAVLDRQNESPKLITVHRIDKETCGCLLLARNEKAALRLTSLFAQRKIVKTYWIVTTAVPDPMEGVIDIPIADGTVDKRSRMVLHPELPADLPYHSNSRHGKRAVTRYKVVSSVGNAALVEVQPETGVKHQIRVHFGFGLSCPILGDHKYSHLKKMAPQKLPGDMLQRLQVRQSKVRHIPLHIYARSITIPQYREGRNLFVMAPMPVHISLNLQKLKFRKN